MNRLVLDLIHTANTQEDSEFNYDSRTGLDPPVFASNSFLGNIGGSFCTLPGGVNDENPNGRERITNDEEAIPDVQFESNSAGSPSDSWDDSGTRVIASRMRKLK